MSTPPGAGRPRRLPAGRNRAISAGLGIFLIAVGAILVFAVTGVSTHGLNVHIVGIILIFAGVLGLLLPGAARSGPRDRLRRWVRPSADPVVSWGRRSAHQNQVQRDAAADVELVEEEDKLFSADGPGGQNDDL